MALTHARTPAAPPRTGHASRRPRSFGTGTALAAAAATAAALAGMALVVRQRARRAERRNPPLGRFVEADGVRLHYVERGEGQPVVLLHGNGSMIQDFALSGVLDRAAGRYRVIAFDRPGYGYSERPRDRLWTPFAQARAIHAALRRLGVERPIVVGHSWGTLVTLALALDFPRDVRSIVLLSGYYFPTLRLDVPLLSPPAIPVIGDLMRYTISPLLGRLLAPGIIRKVFAPSPVSPRFAAGFPVDMSLRPSQIRASAEDTAFMVPSAMALDRRYRELRLPAVIVAGSGDRIVDTRRQSGRLHEELPQSAIGIAPDAGHMIQHIAPDRVLAAIDSAAAAAATAA